MKGLIIKEPWISYILHGEKTWEIRASHSHIRGEVYLIRSGSGHIIGKAFLTDSFLLDEEKFNTFKEKHQIYNLAYSELPYKQPHVWVLNNPTIFKDPIPYLHKKGAVIWVNLHDEER